MSLMYFPPQNLLSTARALNARPGHSTLGKAPALAPGRGLLVKSPSKPHKLEGPNQSEIEQGCLLGQRAIYLGEHNRAFEKAEAGINRRRSKVPCNLATLASDTSCRILAQDHADFVSGKGYSLMLVQIPALIQWEDPCRSPHPLPFEERLGQSRWTC
eukprot:scaffold30072_cov88-Skeletonema_marinoi.AAC.3